MSYAATRLTLYALISGVEEDMRSVIVQHLAPAGEPRLLLGDDLWSKALSRLTREQGVADSAASLEDVVYYLDFSDAYTVLNANRQYLPRNLAEYFQSHTKRLEQLAPIRNRVMHVRPLDYDDLPRTLEYTSEFTKTTQFPWTHLKEAQEKLRVEPSYVLGLTIPVFDSDVAESHNLPTPDFDETGFLGRENQVREVFKLCLGPYPVITIFGEGGVGKTALALKVAYDLLESEHSPFDAIVWTTAKATRLTAQEVLQIEGAIQDSLGLFRDVASHLAGSSTTDPMKEVLGYLAEFKILLILDNLETVLDERIRSFLEKLPTGSKILITSRIGLGAFDFPYKLAALSPNESVQLLRAVAAARGMSEMLSVPNKKLGEYCERMKHNPGFIKWFISAIQAGKRPEEVIAGPHVFLDFCMTNVYQYLKEPSKVVLRAMLSVPGKQTQAELAFLTELDAVDLQRALQQLIITNFVAMASRPVGSSFETRYGIAELAREFLLKHYPPAVKDSAELVKRRRQLVAAGEEVQAEQSRNPYSFQSIRTRSAGDLLIARYLLDALHFSHMGHIDKADAALSKAKDLAPDFFEVFRVEAIVRFRDNNLQAAREAYETAISLEPSSAPLRLFYGNFLARYFDELDLAMEHLQAGLRIDPSSEEIQLEVARVCMYRADFKAARTILTELSGRLDSCNEWFRRKFADTNVAFYQRLADSLSREHDWAGALEELTTLRKYVESLPSSAVDDKIREKVAKAYPTVRRCISHVEGVEARAHAYEVLGWLKEVSRRDFDKEWEAKNKCGEKPKSEMRSGKVCAIRNGFGFIKADASGAGDIFFHRTSMLRIADWSALTIGSRVSFATVEDEKGRKRAVDVDLTA